MLNNAISFEEAQFEKQLQKLFDYQHIAENSRLSCLIDESDNRQIGLLSFDDLQLVSAAGEPEILQHLDMLRQPECTNKAH